MTLPLATRATNTQPSLIRRILADAPSGAINLALGQPDFPIPRALQKAATPHLGTGGYSANAGLPETRGAIARHMDCDRNQVLVTIGSAEALAVWALTGVEQGKHIVVPTPGYPAYAALAPLVGAEIDYYTLDPAKGWNPDPEALAKQLDSDDVGGLVINSPSNPTSVIHNPEVFAPALAVARSRKIPVLSDEVYAGLAFGDRAPSPVTGFEDIATRVSSISKTHNAMGWRIGWMVVPPGWEVAATGVHQFVATCAPVPFQRAAVVALAGMADDEVDENRVGLGRRRDKVLAHLKGWQGVSLPVHPSAGFYLFLDVRELAGMDDEEWCRELAKTAGVVLAPGSGFGPGGRGHVRLSYAVAEDLLEDALTRLDKVLAP